MKEKNQEQGRRASAQEQTPTGTLDPEQTARWIIERPPLPDFLTDVITQALDRAAEATGLPKAEFDDDEEGFTETRRRIAAQAQAIFWQGVPEMDNAVGDSQPAPAEAEDGDEDARPTSYDQPITPERAREIISEFRHHDLDDKVFAAIIALACGIAYENDPQDRDSLATEVVNAVYGHTFEGDDAASRFADRAAGMRFGEAARREEGAS